MLSTPVVFMIFNRPDLTEQVFQSIAEAKPRVLYVIADGPRASHPADEARCAAARAIIERVNWNCEVVRDYAATNLGCKQRVASGLTAAFDRYERAIVIEDDVLPDATMFEFFDAMLGYYADDQRVMMVSGFNPLGQWKAARQQYHFSCCGSIWGWASWRRAWRFYDVNMSLFSDAELRDRVTDVFGDPEIAAPRIAAYARTHRGEVDTWDFQWSFARALQSWLSVVPSTNLVRNLGFRDDATHTRKPRALMSELPAGEMTFPLRFHSYVAPDREYDRQFTRRMAT